VTQDLQSSAPGIYEAMLSLIQTAAGNYSSKILVMPFELAQYEPGKYLMLSSIEHHQFTWESIGSFSQIEKYDILGIVTEFNGDTPTPRNLSIATSVLDDVYTMFNTCVMTPIMSNRTMPILGYTGPGAGPYLMLPGYVRYTASPGNMGDAQVGWQGTINFSYHFEALLTPS
jgi:hypothetical protein